MKEAVAWTRLPSALRVFPLAALILIASCESSDVTAPAADQGPKAVERMPTSPTHRAPVAQVTIEVDLATEAIASSEEYRTLSGGPIRDLAPVTNQEVSWDPTCTGCNDEILNNQVITVKFTVKPGFVLSNIGIANLTCQNCTATIRPFPGPDVYDVYPDGEGPGDMFTVVLDVVALTNDSFTVRFDLLADRSFTHSRIRCIPGTSGVVPSGNSVIRNTWNGFPLRNLAQRPANEGGTGSFITRLSCDPTLPFNTVPVQWRATFANDWHVTLTCTNPPPVVTATFSGTAFPWERCIVCRTGQICAVVPITTNCSLVLNPTTGGATVTARGFMPAANRLITLENIADGTMANFLVNVGANGRFTLALSSSDVTLLQLTVGEGYLITTVNESCGGTVR